MKTKSENHTRKYKKSQKHLIQSKKEFMEAIDSLVHLNKDANHFFGKIQSNEELKSTETNEIYDASYIEQITNQ